MIYLFCVQTVLILFAGCVLMRFKKRTAELQKSFSEKIQNLQDLQETNNQLCDLISETNDRAAKLDELNASLASEKNDLVKRISDIRTQIQSNTDLELATVDQILDELKNRKTRFLMLRPGINDGVNAVASLVSKKDATIVLKIALSGLESQESWKEEDQDDEWSS